MLHQDLRKQLEAVYKKDGVFTYPKLFQRDNGREFKSDMTKLLKNTLRDYTCTAFAEAFNRVSKAVI